MVPTTTKMAVLGLIDRDSGKARFFHVDKASGSNIQPIVLENLSREARLMTDESYIYRTVGKQFASHDAVHHYNKEYVRGDIHLILNAASHFTERRQKSREAVNGHMQKAGILRHRREKGE